MPRQIAVFLSYLILGMFLSIGILTAEENMPDAADTVVVPAVTSAETDKTIDVDAPDTASQGISVKDLELQGGKDQESAVLPDNISQTKKNRETESMIVSKDWSVDGKIVGDKEKKLIISAGDTVYVNIGSDKINKGDVCSVFRKISKIKDPDSGKFLGVEVRRIGKIEITDTSTSKSSSAKVLISYEPINIGDDVKIVAAEE
jgi:ribosomal protein L24